MEVVERIISYACTDGGYTGRSLSLVSRCIHQVASPVRFHSVALNGFRHIESFLACLEKQRSESHAPVHHLFLSTWADGEEVVRVRDGHQPRWNGLRCYQSAAFEDSPQWAGWMTLQEAMDRKLSHLLPRLLQMVAPDLCTLSIVHSWEFGAIQLPRTFPLLRDLTFSGPPPHFPGWTTLPDIPSPPPPCLPSLKHLHVICSHASIAFWTYHAPNMVYLRLSDLSSSATTLVAELQCSVGSSGASLHRHGCSFTKAYVLSDIRSPTRTYHHPSLRHVRLQPRVPQGHGEADPYIEHSWFIWQLKKMHTALGVRVEVLRDRRYPDGYWDARIKEDWVSNVFSHPGWWSGGEELEDGDELDVLDPKDSTGPVDRLLSQWAQEQQP